MNRLLLSLLLAPAATGLLVGAAAGQGFAQAQPGAPVATGYRDGEYAGDRTDAYYGPLQVKAIIKGGRLADIQIVEYPHDRSRSQTINQRALPVLMREALDTQSSSVHVISGATPTSRAFASSLAAALKRAKA